MREFSATVTAGTGSETHNHHLEYRQGLAHTHEREDGVIELIPYRDYREQINEIMRPYITEYNERADERYKAAWERHNRGETKTKPRRRDYKHADYDYCKEHANDTFRNPATNKMEIVPLYREIIIGIGDREDRQNDYITENQHKHHCHYKSYFMW